MFQSVIERKASSFEALLWDRRLPLVASGIFWCICEHAHWPLLSPCCLKSHVTLHEQWWASWGWFPAEALGAVLGASLRPCLCLLHLSLQRHYNDEDPEKEKRIKELELLLMSTENELKGQQALPVRASPCDGQPCLCTLLSRASPLLNIVSAKICVSVSNAQTPGIAAGKSISVRMPINWSRSSLAVCFIIGPQ